MKIIQAIFRNAEDRTAHAKGVGIARVTLDGCRHGGLTELEEAELTEGQCRALSAHRTQESYEGYAKSNLPRAVGYSETVCPRAGECIRNKASE
jgi:hypothetical protein